MQRVHYYPWRKLRIRTPKNFNKRSVCLGVGEGQKDGDGVGGGGGGGPLIVPTVIESKRRGVGWHCVCSPSEEAGY